MHNHFLFEEKDFMYRIYKVILDKPLRKLYAEDESYVDSLTKLLSDNSFKRWHLGGNYREAFYYADSSHSWDSRIKDMIKVSELYPHIEFTLIIEEHNAANLSKETYKDGVVTQYKVAWEQVTQFTKEGVC